MIQRKYDILQQEFTHLKVEHDELKSQYLQEKNKASRSADAVNANSNSNSEEVAAKD